MAKDCVFETEIDPSHKYGVGVWTTAKIVGLIKTYKTLEELKAGYGWLKNFATVANIHQPLPVEIIREGPKLKCKLVKELIQTTR